MIDEILQDPEFSVMSAENMHRVLSFMLSSGVPFAIAVRTDLVRFAPMPPEEITATFGEIVIFELDGYTLESAHIKGTTLHLHTAFGEAMYECHLDIDIAAIMQLLCERVAIATNAPALYKKRNIFKS